MRGHLVTSLRNSLTQRLLHPGADTQDILTQYIHTIKALRVVDPSGTCIQAVGEPVRVYLRGREDTVRCIVSGMTEEGGSTGIFQELTSAPPIDPSMEEDYDTWVPDAVEADPTLSDTPSPAHSSHSKKATDITTLLVNIYGTRELFVSEYRSLLAERILSQSHYDVVKEVRNLELLKLRFGEEDLHTCAVMLRDVVDSKRIAAHVFDVCIVCVCVCVCVCCV